MEQISEADRRLAERCFANVVRTRPDPGHERERPPGLPEDFDLDADDDLLALLLDESERERAWRLTMYLLHSTGDDHEIRQVAISALETLLRDAGDNLADELEVAIRSDRRLRRGIRTIYLSGKAQEIVRREGLGR